MKAAKPEYGWYVKNLIVGFIIVGILGLGIIILSFLFDPFFRYFFLISGVIIALLFLWPGIGFALMNIALNRESNKVNNGEKSVRDSYLSHMKALELMRSPQILDIGCGTGRTAIRIAKLLKNGGRLFGIDIYNKMAIGGNALETVRKNAKLEGVDKKTDFKYGSATEIPFEDNSFDIVNVSSVLHELHEDNAQEKALEEIYRVLKPGGYAYIGEWNRATWRLITYAGIFCLVFKNREYWQKLIQSHKFQIEEYTIDKGFGIFTLIKN